VQYEFADRGEMPAVKLHWYDGGLRPERPEELPPGHELDAEDGVLFVGERGKMLVTGWGGQGVILLPMELNRDYKRPPQALPRSKNGHYHEWIDACKTGAPTTCNFLYSGPLTIANHLGNVAYRAGAKLEWDPVRLQPRNCPAAAPFIQREYRAGWKLG